MDISAILEDYELDNKPISIKDINNLSTELLIELKSKENNNRLIDGSFLDLATHLKQELNDKESVIWDNLSVYVNLFDALCNEFPCLADKEISEIDFVSYAQLRQIDSKSYIYCKKKTKDNINL